MIIFKNLEMMRLKQIELDQFILKSNNINPKDIFEERNLAFIIELAEFLNEEKSFKYWKKTKAIDHHKLIEEYIDGFHFLLSIMNNANITFKDIDLNNSFIKKTKNLTKITWLIVNELSSYNMTKEIKFLKNTISLYLYISDLINLTDEKFVDAYNKKNIINKNRQITGY